MLPGFFLFCHAVRMPVNLNMAARSQHIRSDTVFSGEMAPLMYRLWIAALAASLVICPMASESRADDSHGLPATWKPLGDGFDMSQIDLRSSLFFNSQITFVRFNLIDYRVAVIRASDFGFSRSSARTLCQKARALACINANFFDESGKPLGLVVTRGMTLQNMHRGGKTLTGIFQLSRKEAAIVSRSDYHPESVVEAIQSGPRLISNSQKIPGLKEESSPTRRSGVCIDKSNRIIFYLMSTGFFGLSLDDLRDVLLDDSIQCHDALNLDGGGSAQLYFGPAGQKEENSSSSLFIEGTDEVPIVLGVFPRSSTF